MGGISYNGMRKLQWGGVSYNGVCNLQWVA